MLSAGNIYLWAVAAGPIVLALALAWVLLRGAGVPARAGRHRKGCGQSVDDVDPPEVTRRREFAVQLSIGLGLAVAGGLAGWAYLAAALHHG